MNQRESPRSASVGGLTLARDVWRGVGVVGFLVGGILFAVASAVTFLVEEPIDYLDVHLTLAVAAVLVGVAGFYAVQKESFGRFGQWAVGVFVVGLALVAVGTGATYAGLPVVPFLPATAVGLPLTWLGGLLLGVATYRNGSLPSWSGVLLALGFPAATVAGVAFQALFGTPSGPSGAFSGAVVAGLCWLGVAYALWPSASARRRT